MDRNQEKYQGIIPAFYACYNREGKIDPAAVETFASHLFKKGVKGLYVGGSSGECIYQSVAERKLVLERVMRAVGGKMTVIAHVACNNTADSCELAKHAQSLGVDAIAAIPPIYFHLPEYAICDYWNAISAAAPKTDFVIYNIPQLAGVALTMPLFEEMLKNPKVVAVKNSSMPTQDIEQFKQRGGAGFTVFNGPDEQLVSGLSMGADGGIGGTYGVMPELYLELKACVDQGDLARAREIQYCVNRIIAAMCSGHGNLYAVMKEVIRQREGIDLGGVRPPMPNLIADDLPKVRTCIEMIEQAIETYCR